MNKCQEELHLNKDEYEENNNYWRWIRKEKRGAIVVGDFEKIKQKMNSHNYW
jgi:hypothetical protein